MQNHNNHDKQKVLKNLNFRYINIKAQEDTVIKFLNKGNVEQIIEIKKDYSIHNIINNYGKNLTFDYTGDITIAMSNTRTYSKKQELINKNVEETNVNNTIVYSNLRGNKINPEKIIFSFPAFSLADSECHYFLSTLKRLSDETLLTSLVVSFQDNYGPFGTYMQYDDEGKSIKDDIIIYIESIINKYNLKNSDCIFVGNSKGGTTASIYKYYFKGAKVIDNGGSRNLNRLMIVRPILENTVKYDFSCFGDNTFFTKNIPEYTNNDPRNNIYIYGSKDLNNIGEHDFNTNNKTISTPTGHNVTFREAPTTYLLLELFCTNFSKEKFSGTLENYSIDSLGEIYKFKIPNFKDEEIILHLEFYDKKGNLETTLPLNLLIEGDKYYAVSENGCTSNLSSFLKSNFYSYKINAYSISLKKQYVIEIDGSRIYNRLLSTNSIKLDNVIFSKLFLEDNIMSFSINIHFPHIVNTVNKNLISTLCVYNAKSVNEYSIACSGKSNIERNITPHGFFTLKITKIPYMKALIKIKNIENNEEYYFDVKI